MAFQKTPLFWGPTAARRASKRTNSCRSDCRMGGEGFALYKPVSPARPAMRAAGSFADVGVGSERSALMVVHNAMTPKQCEHCQRDFYRSGRPEQRFCSIECHRAVRYGVDRPTSRRCESCPTVFELGPRQKRKRFCSMHCVGIWREREKRLNRPPSSPRIRKKPGRIEWSIGGMHRGRGMAPTPRLATPLPSAWTSLLTRLGYARVRTGRG